MSGDTIPVRPPIEPGGGAMEPYPERRRTCFRVASGLLALAFAMAQPGAVARAQIVSPDFWVTNGSVYAAAVSGSTLYIGGSFTRVGPATGCGIPFDVGSDTPQGGFAKVAGTIRTIASDGAGGWFIGGRFSGVGGVARSNIAHIRADHTVDTWNPSADSAVFALALSGNVLDAGG